MTSRLQTAGRLTATSECTGQLKALRVETNNFVSVVASHDIRIARSSFLHALGSNQRLDALNIAEIQLHSQITPEPHWYLAMLGVSSECQGQGIGGRVLQPVLQAADQSNIPCYLEGSSAANVRFYQRHGFEIAHHEIFAGYEFWGMKRQPQTDTHYKR